MNNNSKIPIVLIIFFCGILAGLFVGTTNIENLDLPDNIKYVHCDRGYATMHWEENEIYKKVEVKSISSNDAFMSLLKKVHERNKHEQ